MVAVGESQHRFLLSDARFVGFIGGVGSGKTVAGALKALGKIGQGEPGIIVSPDYPHFAKSTWPEFERWRDPSRIVARNRSEKWERYDTGAVVFYGGIDDPDAWRGPNVNWVWFDEGARHRSRKAFDVLAGRIRVGERPQMWITTTPAGRNHWLYRIFVERDFAPDALEAAGGAERLAEFVQARTAENRENLDPLYYASLQAMYTGEFARQELEGEFVSFEGLVYADFGPENITTDAEYALARGPVEWAYDDGFTNPRVILFLQRGGDGSVCLFDEYYRAGEQGAASIEAALDMLAAHAGTDDNPRPLPEIAVGDPSAAELADALRRADITARGAKCEVIEGIKVVRRAVKDGNGKRWLRVHPRCVNFIREMGSYAYPEGGEGRNEAEQPVKANDHGPDALRYWTFLRWRRTNLA